MPPRASVTTEFTEFVKAIEVAQRDHAATGKRFLQLQPTSRPPDDGKRLAQSYGKPAHRQSGILDTPATLPATSAVAFRIDEYAGKHGKGYVVTGFAERDGQTFSRRTHVGSDPAFASYGWRRKAVETPPEKGLVNPPRSGTIPSLAD